MNNYFTIKELCYSYTAEQKGIDNSPSKEIEEHLKELISFLNPIREKWGSGIRVNSGYRCPELNKAVGGVDTSAHMLGYAADLYPVNDKFDDFKTFIVNYLQDKEFDQCILETSGNSEWIHLGLYNNRHQQRKQIFKLTK